MGVTGIFRIILQMSIQGAVIVPVGLLARWLLRRQQLAHKYLLVVWAVVFFYLLCPWKLELSVGFWRPADNATVAGTADIGAASEEGAWAEAGSAQADAAEAGSMQAGTRNGRRESETVRGQGTEADGSRADGSEAEGAGLYGTPQEQPGKGGAAAEEVGTDGADTDNTAWTAAAVWRIASAIWLFGVAGLWAYLFFSVLALKRRLLLSVRAESMEGRVYLAEAIDTPMVLGVLRPAIYLPLAVGEEELPFVVAHERMHIRRRDTLWKLLAYCICILHWFNPLAWAAYYLLGCDIEKACDEEVIHSMGEERRREYARALLHMAAGDQTGRKRSFVAPVCFDEGNVKGRIQNILAYRYTLPAKGVTAALLFAALCTIFLTRTEATQGAMETKMETETEMGGVASDTEVQEALPVFLIRDESALGTEEPFAIEDYFITNRYTFSNHFYIDETGVLWGTGSNEYGQLGTGAFGEEAYEQPVKIAEHVLSVDADWNGYFCIYLTDSGELYGMGMNVGGLLAGTDAERQEGVYSNNDYTRVPEPVLLLEEVQYAAAGRECIAALREDGSVYWWGQYRPVTLTRVSGDLFQNYWTLEEDVTNPCKLFYGEPVKILENCRYVTTGAYTGAAISAEDELYTWGFNAFGQCGTAVEEDDFVRAPRKVMDDVEMVWVESIERNDPAEEPSFFWGSEFDYAYNTFVLTKDHELLAAGEAIGEKQKTTQLTGDLIENETHSYSDEFLPVRTLEYSDERNRKALNALSWGMPAEEVEKYLADNDLRYFRGQDWEEETLCVENSRYYCHFDHHGRYRSLDIQEGRSLDDRFGIGMTLSLIERNVEMYGGSMEPDGEDEFGREVYRYIDLAGTEYLFYLHDGILNLMTERGTYFEPEDLLLKPHELLGKCPFWMVRGWHVLKEQAGEIKDTYSELDRANGEDIVYYEAEGITYATLGDQVIAVILRDDTYTLGDISVGEPVTDELLQKYVWKYFDRETAAAEYISNMEERQRDPGATLAYDGIYYTESMIDSGESRLFLEKFLRENEQEERNFSASGAVIRLSLYVESGEIVGICMEL